MESLRKFSIWAVVLVGLVLLGTGLYQLAASTGNEPGWLIVGGLLVTWLVSQWMENKNLLVAINSVIGSILAVIGTYQTVAGKNGYSPALTIFLGIVLVSVSLPKKECSDKKSSKN